MKTAMQELIEFLEPELKMHDFSQLPAYEKAKELLEREKQQIIEAYNDAITNERGIKSPPTNGRKYFEKKYEQ